MSPRFKPRDVGSAFIGVLVGIIFGLVWIFCIKSFVDKIQVGQSEEYWINIAHTQYSICYDGCNDCLDVGSIEKACQMTARTQVSGTICDASKLWAWEDRYPPECLQALGEIYKADKLWWKKFWYRSLYAFALIGIPLGLGAYYTSNWLHKRAKVPAFLKHRPLVRRSRQQTNSRTPLLTAATVSLLALATFPTPANAYACMNYHPAHNQLFANTDNTLYGVIHGWLSNCYDETYSCGESCTTSPPNEKGSQTSSCSAITCTQPRTDMAPADFVRTATRYVEGCGFRKVDVAPGVVDKRIANPRIEGRLWVKVAVNRFNGSEGLEEQVMCLYNMVKVLR